MARSTFPSQNVKNTRGSDHFWRFGCRKSARRCGAKHISKSKCAKKKHVRATFGGSDVASLHYTTLHLHYTPQHYNHNYTTTQLHSTTLNYTPLHSITLNYTPLHYTTFHYTSLHYIALRYTPLHYNYTTTLHYTKLHYTTLHYTTLHYTTIHYTTLLRLHFTTWH